MFGSGARFTGKAPCPSIRLIYVIPTKYELGLHEGKRDRFEIPN